MLASLSISPCLVPQHYSAFVVFDTIYLIASGSSVLLNEEFESFGTHHARRGLCRVGQLKFPVDQSYQRLFSLLLVLSCRQLLGIANGTGLVLVTAFSLSLTQAVSVALPTECGVPCPSGQSLMLGILLTLDQSTSCSTRLSMTLVLAHLSTGALYSGLIIFFGCRLILSHKFLQPEMQFQFSGTTGVPNSVSQR